MACQFYCPRHYGLTMNAVNDFVQQHSFVDVKLVCKNKKTVYSHKLILASASPFLKTVIEEMNNFDDMATVFLPDFDYNIVSLLLTFLCEGIMKLKWEELEEFRELCNGLGMNFPGADVVKVSNESHYSQSSSSTVKAADIAADTERGILIEKSSSLVSSRDLDTPAKVPDAANTHDAIASIVPKIEDCEECQNCQVTQPVLGSDFQNTSQMLHVGTVPQRVTDSDLSQLEIHRQISSDTRKSVVFCDARDNTGSRQKVVCPHSDTHTDLNLQHTTSSSAQTLSQNNETSLLHSAPSVPKTAERDNFHSSHSHFAHQNSTQQMVKRSKGTTKQSRSEGDVKSIPLISMSTEQVHFYISNAGSANATSSSAQKISQKNEMSQMHTIPLMPLSAEQDNFRSNNSHFARQNSTQQMVKHSKTTIKNSHSEGDLKYILLTPVSAEQSVYQQIKKQPKAKTKKLHNGAGVQKKHLTQILNVSSVHKKLLEQTGAISHKTKQSLHLKSSSKSGDSKVFNKTEPVEKCVQPKKKKKCDETDRQINQSNPNSPKVDEEQKVYFCPACEGKYEDPPEEDWIKCLQCHDWWHEGCTAYEYGNFICDLCKARNSNNMKL